MAETQAAQAQRSGKSALTAQHLQDSHWPELEGACVCFSTRVRGHRRRCVKEKKKKKVK